MLIGLYRGFKIYFLESFDDFAGAVCGILLLFFAWFDHWFRDLLTLKI